MVYRLPFASKAVFLCDFEGFRQKDVIYITQIVWAPCDLTPVLKRLRRSAEILVPSPLLYDWRSSGSAFRISFQTDWKNDSGRFHTRDG